MAITKRMRQINEEYKAGISLDELSSKYGITVGSVLEKIKKLEHYEKAKLSGSHHIPTSWTDEKIKSGIERYIEENGNMPSAQDFDECLYLPSARQVQRNYGGIVKLRSHLGYGDIDYTRGELRGAIAKRGNSRGLDAEDALEPLLIDRFGEPFVHVQKRYYKGSKNRYDFLVYAKDTVLGVDIFTTDRAKYIQKNVRHKISRYVNAPHELELYFVLAGEYTQEDINSAIESISSLKNHENMHVLLLSEFMRLINSIEPLTLPESFVGL